jgi:hypothetical protein
MYILRNEGHFMPISSEFTAQTSSLSVSMTMGLFTTVPSVGGCGGTGQSGAEIYKEK